MKPLIAVTVNLKDATKLINEGHDPYRIATLVSLNARIHKEYLEDVTYAGKGGGYVFKVDGRPIFEIDDSDHVKIVAPAFLVRKILTNAGL